MSPFRILPGLCEKRSQIDSPLPSVCHAPSIWYEAVPMLLTTTEPPTPPIVDKSFKAVVIAAGLAAFSGNIEDSDSITKFNSETGLIWKEYRR